MIEYCAADPGNKTIFKAKEKDSEALFKMFSKIHFDVLILCLMDYSELPFQ